MTKTSHYHEILIYGVGWIDRQERPNLWKFNLRQIENDILFDHLNFHPVCVCRIKLPVKSYGLLHEWAVGAHHVQDGDLKIHFISHTWLKMNWYQQLENLNILY